MRFHGTTVTFFKRSDGALIGYRAGGHSGYAEAGEDIVCAGVSALTQSTLNGLQNIPAVFRKSGRCGAETQADAQYTRKHLANHLFENGYSFFHLLSPEHWLLCHVSERLYLRQSGPPLQVVL